MRQALLLARAAALALIAASTTAAASSYAVTDLRLVDAATRADALNACHSVGDSVSVGVDWGYSTTGGRVHLCQTRVAIDTQQPPRRMLQRVVVASSASSCPVGLERLASPRANVLLCVGYTATANDVDNAIAYADFVSDVAVTSERNYNNDYATPEWYTFPVSLHTQAGSITPSYRGVFLSVRRPIRPIIGVQVLRDAGALMGGSGCKASLGADWREADNAADVDTKLLCLQSPRLDNATDVRVLIDVARVAKAQATCVSDGDLEKVKVTGDLVLYLKWMPRSQATTLVTDLVLHRVEDGTDPTKVEYLPGGFHLVANLNGKLNVNGNVNTNPVVNSSPVYVFTRSWTPTKLSLSPSLTKPPLRAVAQSSSATQQLRFKILQIADLHFTGDPTKACRDAPASGLCTEAVMSQWINDLLDMEQPDFVAFTGDNVETFTPSRRQQAMDAVTQGVEARGIPHGMVFGNHDDENGFPREELVRLAASKPHSYTQRGPTSIDGVGNYELGVQAPVDGVWGLAGTEVFRMYFLDSHGYPDRTKYPQVSSTYDWVKPNQIAFYRSLSEAHAAQKNRVPAVMFFHIPLVEYAANAASKTHGEQYEAVASSDVSTNLFSTLVDAGEVKATFCGHDHVNDYCYEREGVQLCYGGGAGFGQAYGRSTFARRARVIEWSMDRSGQRTLRSWKRHFGDLQSRKSEEVLYQD